MLLLKTCFIRTTQSLVKKAAVYFMHPYGLNLLTINMSKSSLIAALTNRLDEAEKTIRFLKIDVLKIRRELESLKESDNAGLVCEFSKLVKRPNSDDSTPNCSKKLKTEFDFEGDFVVVYTDGACTNNGRAGSKAGIGVWWGDDHPLNVSKPTINRQTNNAAEIQACTEACRIAAENNIEKLLIKTDSQFVINCMNNWIKKWKKNNWKTAAGKDVINKDDLVPLETSMKLLKNVKFEHIRGHSGHYGNEEADKLAVNGAK